MTSPTRRAILVRLARGEATVGDLARPFSISLPAVSRRLRVLERARLIERRVDGQRRVCRLRAQPLRAAAGWIERYRSFWEERLDELAALIEAPPPAPKRRKR
jgi:DNA-binding transcriptional ArsR family regulator